MISFWRLGVPLMSHAEMPKTRVLTMVAWPSLACTSAAYDHCTAKYLAQARVKVTALRLGDREIHGKGHMVMLEKNNLRVAGVIAGWLVHTILAH
jgi:hypothetical protein